MAVAKKKKKVFDDRYEILSIVGRGSASVVYHARHIKGDEQEVALKVLVTQRHSIPRSDLLRKEALAMVSSRHRYVIRLDDFHSVGELCYLSMEFAPHGDLRRFVNSIGGKLSADQAVLYLRQSAEALKFIHDAGILHRDIKPDNILVISAKEIRLGDFGVAILPGEESSVEELQNGVGTMNYMAPEVLDGTGYDNRSDLFALGVAFYEMLSGVHPFEDAPLIKQLEVRKEGNYKPIGELVPDIPESLSLAIDSLMAYDLDNRVPSATELLKILGGRGKARGRRKSKDQKAEESAKNERQEKVSSSKSAASKKSNSKSTQRRRKKKANIRQQEDSPPTQVISADSEEAKALREVIEQSKGSSVEETTPEPSPEIPSRPIPQPQNIQAQSSQSEASSSSAKSSSTLKALKEASDDRPIDGIRRSEPKSEFHPVAPNEPVAAITEENSQEKKSEENEEPAFLKALKQKGGAFDAHATVATTTQEEPEGLEPEGEEPAKRLSDELEKTSATSEFELPQDPEQPTEIPPNRKADSPRPVQPKESSITGSAFEAGALAEEEDDEFDPFAEAPAADSMTFGPDQESTVNAIRANMGKGAGNNAKKLGLAVVGFIALLFIWQFLSSDDPSETIDPTQDPETVTLVDPDLVDDSEEEIESGQEAKASLGIPPVDASEIQFPFLSSGIYHGQVQGLYGRKSIPLTIISTESISRLTLLVGIAGWEPIHIDLRNYIEQAAKGENITLDVVGNGLILSMNGVNVDGEIHGYFRNKVSKEEGAWQIRPLQ